MAPHEDEISTVKSESFLTRLQHASTVFSRLRTQRQNDATRFASRMARVSSGADATRSPLDGFSVSH
jgi:hypothetical protein